MSPFSADGRGGYIKHLPNFLRKFCQSGAVAGELELEFGESGMISEKNTNKNTSSLHVASLECIDTSDDYV